MTNGKPCGKPDGHSGKHRSPEAEQRARDKRHDYNVTAYWKSPEDARQRSRAWYWNNRDHVVHQKRVYRTTAAGMMVKVRANAKKRGM